MKEKIKKLWIIFNKLFWVIFIAKVVLAYGVTPSIEQSGALVTILAMQSIMIIAMVIVMGWFAYKFSGKKIYWLTGLLGFLWFGIVLIFVGYLVIKKLKDNQLKNIQKSTDTQHGN